MYIKKIMTNTNRCCDCSPPFLPHYLFKKRNLDHERNSYFTFWISNAKDSCKQSYTPLLTNALSWLSWSSIPKQIAPHPLILLILAISLPMFSIWYEWSTTCALSLAICHLCFPNQEQINICYYHENSSFSWNIGNIV